MYKKINDYEKQLLTKKGEIVKSYYELKVANFLAFHDIRYIYEMPSVFINGAPFVPDFYLPDFDVYLEVWGMTNSGAYNFMRHQKRELYKESRFKLIELWPNNRANCWWWIKIGFQNLLRIPFPQKAPVPYFRYKKTAY